MHGWLTAASVGGVQIEWISSVPPVEVSSRSSASRSQAERPAEGEAVASQRALPEHADGPETTEASASPPPAEPQGHAASAPGTSSNVVPKEASKRDPVPMAAAASAVSADEISMEAPQQGQWLTASFDELPER